MDYRPSNSTPSTGLTLNLAQFNGEGIVDYKKLNTTPAIIIPGVADHYILPAWYFIDAKINNGNPGINIYFGDRSGFDTNGLYAYTGLINQSFAIGNLSLFYQPSQIPNPLTLQQTGNFSPGSDLVMWQQADDTTMVIPLFKIQIGYYLLPLY